MRRTRPFLITLTLAITAVSAIAAPTQTAATYEPLRLYLEAISLVHERYVDPLSWDRLARLGARGLVAELDADSEVLTPRQYRELTMPTSQSGFDIGLVLTRRDHALTVETAIEAMPAAQAGVLPGDRIIEIDGVNTRDMLAVDARERLRGAAATPVTLKILRRRWANPQPYTIVRAPVPAGTVSVRDLGGGVLCARIRELDGSSPQELSQALGTAAATEAKGLILDLRGTPGKDVGAAVNVAGLFLGGGTLAARVESRMPSQPRELRTPTEPASFNLPMAVLADRGTAAASEVLAGALRDSHRAVIVGTATFGDASMQSLIPLSDGSALSLTTSRYVTPKGVTIDGKGITPDFMVNAQDTGRADLTRASGGIPPSDPQLALALDIVKAASIVEHGESMQARGEAARR